MNRLGVGTELSPKQGISALFYLGMAKFGCGCGCGFSLSGFEPGRIFSLPDLEINPPFSTPGSTRKNPDSRIVGFQPGLINPIEKKN